MLCLGAGMPKYWDQVTTTYAMRIPSQQMKVYNGL